MKIHSPTSVDELKDLFGTGATQAEKEAIGCCIDTSGIAGTPIGALRGASSPTSYNENDPLCWDVSKITRLQVNRGLRHLQRRRLDLGHVARDRL